MLTDANSNEDRSTSLLTDETGDSCRLEYIEIVPLTRDTDGPCTTDCDSEDWSAQVKQEIMSVVKQEPDGVRTMLSFFAEILSTIVIYDTLERFLLILVSQSLIFANIETELL